MIANLAQVYLIIKAFWERAPWLWGALVTLSSIYALANELWASLFARIDALIMPAVGASANFAPLSLVNYVFPLDTVLQLIVAYAGLRAACAVIRIIKSFVPTVA